MTVTSSPATITGLTQGATYQFIVQAINIFGPGTASTSWEIKAAYIPTTLGKVNVTESSLTTKVTFTWPAPLSDNGDSVTAYKLMILDGTGIY